MNMLQKLGTIETFRDAVDSLRDVNAITSEQAYELNGFGLMPGSHKDRLVGVPFLIIEYNFRIGNDESEYVECALITTRDERHIMRDSSKGIFAQLKDIHAQRVGTGGRSPNLAYYARKGLSYQTFPYTKPDGTYVRPRTYYLS